MTLRINDNGVDRDMTDDEIAYIKQTQKIASQESAAIAAQLEAKQTFLESARAKLSSLGLSEEEIAALIGG